MRLEAFLSDGEPFMSAPLSPPAEEKWSRRSSVCDLPQACTDITKSLAGQTLQTPAACLHTFTSVSSAHAGYCGLPEEPAATLPSSSVNWPGGIWLTGS